MMPSANLTIIIVSSYFKTLQRNLEGLFIYIVLWIDDGRRDDYFHGREFFSNKWGMNMKHDYCDVSRLEKLIKDHNNDLDKIKINSLDELTDDLLTDLLEKRFEIATNLINIQIELSLLIEDECRLRSEKMFP